jgi:F0F1-type ATP synthase membrane subunit c/vacuolar-type H+-ATPase subunit K
VTATPRAAAEVAAPPVAPRSRTKGLLIGIALGLVALLAAYGAGRLQGAQATNAAEDRAEASSQVTTELQATLLRFEARRKLHLALLALDERNFGIAQQHVSEAGGLLTKSGPAGGVPSLAAELSGAKLVATEDLGAQRGRVIGWARKLDAALPAVAP